MTVTDELTADVTVSILVSALSTDYFILASSVGEFEASSEANVGVDEINKMIGYFKASNTGSGDYFGNSIALSDDGTTLAVGAPYEYNSATGVITDGSETTDVSEAILSGAVYLFSHNSGKWVQTAYVKASNTGANDYFGYKVALSDDGTTLAVGAYREGNTAKGVFTDGSEVDGDVGTADRPGAVYLFNNSGGTWTQIAYVKASNTSSNDQFGTTLALSGDGSTLAVGARYEDNATAGVITDGSEVAGHTGGGLYYSTGAVYVFSNSSGAWVQTAYVKSSSPESFDFFGNSVALSNDGTTLAVGAPGEDNGFTGILTDGSEAGGGGTREDSGAVYLFSNSSGTWEPTTYIKAADASEDDFFGVDLALSGDGETLVVGTPYDDNSATGVITDGSESVDVGSASDSGAVYLFSKSGGSWAQTTYFKASNPGANDYFGNFLALSDDGATLAVGAVEEDNSATGIIIDGSESPDNGGGDVSTAEGSGAVYLFTITDGSWGQTAYIKASNTGGIDYFSASIALNSDGTTLVISSTKEDNSATGIITDGSENSDTGTGDVDTAYDSGAVYIY
jgi:hypothetical protein